MNNEEYKKALEENPPKIIEKLDFMDYTIAKQVFQQLLVAPYLHHNYRSNQIYK